MRNPFRRKASQQDHDATATLLGIKRERPAHESLMERVWKAPADFNRAARRQARLWGSIWKWDSQALGLDPQLPPRYVRRHHNTERFLRPTTRRQRKHRARIIAAMRRRGEL